MHIEIIGCGNSKFSCGNSKFIGCGNSKFVDLVSICCVQIFVSICCFNLLTLHLKACVASCTFISTFYHFIIHHHPYFLSPSPAKLYRSTRTNQTCYMCRRKGHLARNCPAGAGLPRGTLMICVHCGTPGHLGWECHLFNRLKRKLILPRKAQEDM